MQDLISVMRGIVGAGFYYWCVRFLDWTVLGTKSQHTFALTFQIIVILFGLYLYIHDVPAKEVFGSPVCLYGRFSLFKILWRHYWQRDRPCSAKTFVPWCRSAHEATSQSSLHEEYKYIPVFSFWPIIEQSQNSAPQCGTCHCSILTSHPELV